MGQEEVRPGRDAGARFSFKKCRILGRAVDEGKIQRKEGREGGKMAAEGP